MGYQIKIQRKILNLKNSSNEVGIKFSFLFYSNFFGIAEKVM